MATVISVIIVVLIVAALVKTTSAVKNSKVGTVVRTINRSKAANYEVKIPRLRKK